MIRFRLYLHAIGNMKRILRILRQNKKRIESNFVESGLDPIAFVARSNRSRGVPRHGMGVTG